MDYYSFADSGGREGRLSGIILQPSRGEKKHNNIIKKGKYSSNNTDNNKWYELHIQLEKLLPTVVFF